jgi:hypothetical protein
MEVNINNTRTLDLTQEDIKNIQWSLINRSFQMYDDAVAYKKQGNEEAFKDCHKEYLRAQELAYMFLQLLSQDSNTTAR